MMVHFVKNESIGDWCEPIRVNCTASLSPLALQEPEAPHHDLISHVPDLEQCARDCLFPAALFRILPALPDGEVAETLGAVVGPPVRTRPVIRC